MVALRNYHVPLEKRKGELLKEVLHLLIPELIGAARPRRQHGRQHALSAVLLAIEELEERQPGLWIVFVDGWVQAGADVQCAIRGIAQREQHEDA